MYSVKKEREAITESSVLFHKHGACTAKHHLLNTGLAIVQIINGKSLALSSAKEVLRSVSGSTSPIKSH